MHPELLVSLRQLSDAELMARVKDLAERERGATTLLVAHLAELDTREAHFRAGHGSLYAYCRDVLALSEQEAYNRIAVARAARRFPVVLDLLESGALNLTTVRLLGPHLTPENHRAVLDGARGKTKAQVEEIAAALWPRPDAPSLVRKLPGPRQAGGTGLHPVPALSPHEAVSVPPGGGGRTLPGAPPDTAAPDSTGATALPGGPALPGTPATLEAHCPGSHAPAVTAHPDARADRSSWDSNDTAAPDAAGRSSLPAAPQPATRRSAEVTPLSPDRYRVQVTIGIDTLEKLRLAKDLLRHAVPSGDEAVILDRALTALLADIAHRKFAAAERPRPSGGQSAAGSRHVPADVKRKVWLRDLGRCAFVGTTGRRCQERAFLEFHHVTPFALGGEATVANIQLRCRSHNAYEARLYFGHGNANGAGSVREAAPCYGSRGGPTRRCSLAIVRTRSGTSSLRDTLRGPAP